MSSTWPNDLNENLKAGIINPKYYKIMTETGHVSQNDSIRVPSPSFSIAAKRWR